MEKGSEEEVKGSRTQVGSREFTFNREDSFIQPFSTQRLASSSFIGFAPGNLVSREGQSMATPSRSVGSGKKQSPQRLAGF